MTDLLSVSPDKQAELLPFHAINEFMRNDYRLSVVRGTLTRLSTLPGSHRSTIDRLTRQFVRVPGFRNSDKAPAMVKAAPMAEAFEKSPDLVAAVLNAWAELHPELRKQVFDFLTARQWDLLPLDADRTKLPGFFIKWPKGGNFEELFKAFQEMFPDAKDNSDDVSLMIVWVGMRLPYQFEEEEKTASPEHEEAPSP